MTDWIEHTTDTCPVDPETVVEVLLRGARSPEKRTKKAKDWWWGNNSANSITHYRIITPAPTPPLFLGGDPVKPAWLDDPDPGADPAKPPKPEMTNPPNYLDTLSEEQRRAVLLSCPPKPEPDLITLRLECLKLAATLDMAQILGAHLTFEQVADIFLHYVLNGPVDKA
jgi:hypothetical protein